MSTPTIGRVYTLVQISTYILGIIWCYYAYSKPTLTQTLSEQTLQSQKQETLKKLSTLREKKAKTLKQLDSKQKIIKNYQQKFNQTTDSLNLTKQNIILCQQDIESLNSKYDNLAKELQLQSQQFSNLIPIFERLSIYPTDTLITADHSSPRSTYGLVILKTLSQQLEYQAKQIITIKQALEDIKVKKSQKLQTLTQLQESLTAQKNNLANETKQAKLDQKRIYLLSLKISQEAAKTAKKARTLDDAIKSIIKIKRNEETKLQNQENLQASEQSNALSSPNNTENTLSQSTQRKILVDAPIISLWGSKTDFGPAQGISYAPASQAVIYSPCKGQIEFAGPFRGYGHMVILNCGQNYRFVLAGMALLNVNVGQSIGKYNPIGKMPNWSVNKNTGRPILFVQLRKGEKVINPSPFL